MRKRKKKTPNLSLPKFPMKGKISLFSQLQFQVGVLEQRNIYNTFLYKRENNSHGLRMEAEICQDISSMFLSKTVLQILLIICSGPSDLVCFGHSPIPFPCPPTPFPSSPSILPSGFCSLLRNETLSHNGYTVRNIFEYTFRKHSLCRAAMIPNSNCLD